MSKPDEMIVVMALVCFIGGGILSAFIMRSHRFWISEPFEPTIKITIENGVQDTTYGYTFDEILKK